MIACNVLHVRNKKRVLNYPKIRQILTVHKLTISNDQR